MNVLGNNIKNLRTRAGMTLEKLSELSKVSKSTISEIERGKVTNCKKETLENVSKALNVSVSELSGVEVETEYYLTDIKEAFEMILSQTCLTVDGDELTNDARKHLELMIKMAIESTKGIQLASK